MDTDSDTFKSFKCLLSQKHAAYKKESDILIEYH